MTTLGTMKARIAAELARPDIQATSTIISDAINTAIAAYQNERFRFSAGPPNDPATFPTVIGRYIYTSADNASIGTLKQIDYVLIQIGNTLQELDRDTAENIITYNQVNTMSGQPSSYAYEGNQLLLAAVPADVWTVTLGIFEQIAAPADDNEVGNPWMIEGEVMIRSRAKYEIALHRLRNPTLAAAMSPDPPLPGAPMGAAYRAWSVMKGSANRVGSLGRVRPMPF